MYIYVYRLRGTLHDTEKYNVYMCRSVLQCVAVCCSVLQCVAVCCSASSLKNTKSPDDHEERLDIYTHVYIYIETGIHIYRNMYIYM